MTRACIGMISLAALCLSSGPAPGAPATWGSLEPGRYAVGTDSSYLTDRTRPWYPEPGETDPLRSAHRGRPVRVRIWYPAEATELPSLRVRDYLGADDPSGWSDVESALRAYDLGEEGGGLAGLVGGPEKVGALLDQPMMAQRSAPPAAGRFPLVVYSLGQNNFTQENLVLWEYLASHGFVVVTVPDLGTSPRRFHLWIHEPLSFEAQLRDLELACAWALERSFVDAGSVWTMGHSMGGSYALLLAMRNPIFRGVIGLDASLMAEDRPPWEVDVAELPFWSPDAVQIPVLQLFKGSAPSTPEVLETLLYSERYLVRLDDLVHGDFQSAPLFRAAVGAPADPRDLEVRPEPVGVRGAEQIFRLVGDFLGWASNAERTSPWEPRLVERDLAGSVQVLAGVQGPTAEELYGILVGRGLTAARDSVGKTLAVNPGREILSRPAMQALGNELLWGGDVDRALEVGELWVLASPGVVASHLYLARALGEAGREEAARAELEKVLELDPQNEEARTRLGTD